MSSNSRAKNRQTEPHFVTDDPPQSLDWLMNLLAFLEERQHPRHAIFMTRLAEAVTPHPQSILLRDLREDVVIEMQDMAGGKMMFGRRSTDPAAWGFWPTDELAADSTD